MWFCLGTDARPFFLLTMKLNACRQGGRREVHVASEGGATKGLYALCRPLREALSWVELCYPQSTERC